MNEGKIRSLAVEIVDYVHGYTVEFSNQPEAHEQDYDFVEAILHSYYDKLNFVALAVEAGALEHRMVCAPAGPLRDWPASPTCSEGCRTFIYVAADA